ncbi:hypothetical protein [Streptomyces sp. NPDC048639]|uniref:hypothetical protein n=1 Tax=Streptomyces sp. NPDC048639 TaxID=3365581 RepID=UPI0037103889
MDDITRTFVIETGLVLALALAVTFPALLGAWRERRIDTQLRDAERGEQEEREGEAPPRHARVRPLRDEPVRPAVTGLRTPRATACDVADPAA